MVQINDPAFVSGKWIPFDGPLTSRPRNRRETIAMFGDPTRGGLYMHGPDPRWAHANIVDLWQDDAIPEIPAKFDFQCHRLLEVYYREGFRRSRLAAPNYEVVKAASWVYRRMRWDTPEKAAAEHRHIMPFSEHAFGTAVDINDFLNKTKTFKKGEKQPKPWSKEWFKIWPQGLPQVFVEAWESVGFESGCRWIGFVDPMHLQFVGKRTVIV